MLSTPSNILVTGSLGFIGKRVVRALRGAGHNVEGRDKDWMGGDLDPIHGVIHLAAVSRVKAGEEDPLDCVSTNCLFTAQMLSIARLANAWFVLIGTQEQGDNFYGMSKRFAEAYAKRYAAANGMTLMVIRPPVVWGEGDNPDKLLPRIVGRRAEIDPGQTVRIAHVDEVVNAITDHMGMAGEYDILGDKIRLGSLEKLVAYVADTHP